MWTSLARQPLARRRTIAVALGCALFAAPSAQAATTSDGFGLGFLAANGETNNVSLSLNAAGTHLRAIDVGNTNVPGASSDCVAVGGNSSAVDCPGGDVQLAIVQLFDKNDFFSAEGLYSVPIFVDGGTGKDTMTGGAAGDQMGGAVGDDIANGSGGDDTYDDEVNIAIFFGGVHSDGDGNDIFNGDAGRDTFLAGTNNTTDDTGVGADTFNGGIDFDTADYSQRTAPLSLSVDAGFGNDGAAGEGDTLQAAERILGGSAADVIVGGVAGSTLVGNGGADKITGGAAADRLVGDAEDGGGSSGDDVLDGGGGADVFVGGPGRDTASYASRNVPVTVTLGAGVDDGAAGENDDVRVDIERLVGGSAGDTLTGDDAANALLGGGGSDVITGGDGPDTVDAGPGDDRVEVRDLTPDAIVCGEGTDTVVVDAADTVAADCEIVDRPLVVSAGGGSGGAGDSAGAGGSGGSGSAGGGAGTGGGAVAPTAIVLGTKPLKLVGGRRVKVTLTCPAPGDCAGDLTLTLDQGKRLLVSLPFGVPAGKTRTFTLTLSAKVRKRLKRGKKNAVSLAATRTGAAAAIATAKI